MAEHIDWDAMFANVKPQDDGEHIEHEKQTCQNCYHYKCCSDFGLVLDPLHGGVICDNFVSTADVAPVVHGRWIVRHKGMNNWVDCSECGTVGSPNWKRCPVCEAKMEVDNPMRKDGDG